MLIMFPIHWINLQACVSKNNQVYDLIECKKCRPIKDSLLFIDNQNNILIRLEAVEFHPSMQKKLEANNYYTFYQYAYMYEKDTIFDLKNIIDLNTFKKIKNSKNFFEDKNYVYSTPYLPIGRYFNVIDKKAFVKFSTNADTLYSRFGEFYKGIKINN